MSCLAVSIMLLTVVVLSVKSSSITTQFVKNLAEKQKWNEVVLVYCSDQGELETFMKWRKILGPLLHLRVFRGSSDPKILSTRLVSSDLPVTVLPSCHPQVNFIVQASKYGLMNKYFSWWIIWNENLVPAHHTMKYHNKTGDLYLQRKMEKLKIPLDTYVNVVTLHSKIENGREMRWANIWDVYRLRKKTPLTWRLIAHWCDDRASVFSTGSLRLSQSQTLPTYKNKLRSRSSQLEGVTMRTGVIKEKPDFEYDCYASTETNGRVMLSGGYSAQLLRILQSVLKFNRVLVYRASGLPLTKDVFVLTFTSSLWFCLCLVLILLVVSLRFSTQKNAQIRNDRTSWTWVEVAVWAICATCQQGCDKEPQGPSCRVVFIVGYIGSYLIFTAFAAGVTSLLAVEGQDTNLQLKNVARMHLGLAVYLDGLLAISIQNSTEPGIASLYSKELSKECNQIYKMSDLMSRIEESNYVSLGSEHLIEQYISTKMTTKQACQLTLSRVRGTHHLKAFAVQKLSPYKDVFNYWLLRARESGLLRVASDRSMAQLADCGSGPGYSSAGIGHVMSAVMILGSGVGIALLILLAEMAWYRHKRQQLWETKSREDIMRHLHHARGKETNGNKRRERQSPIN